MIKKKNIIALVIGLLILVGCYAFLVTRPKKQTDTTNTSDASKAIEVLKIDAAKVKKIDIKAPKGNFTLDYSGGKWKVDGVSYSMNQSSVDSMANTVIKLVSTKLVEKNASDLSKYGLNNPTITATVYLNDNTQKTLLVGDGVIGGTDNYVKLQDSNDVYTANVDSYLNVKLNDLRDKTLPTIDASNITDVVYEKDGKKAEIKKREQDGNIQYDPLAYVLYDYYSYPTGVNGDSLSKAMGSVSSISISDIVEDDAKDLSKYGLDKPKLHLTVKDSNNQTLDIMMGNDKDSSMVYFKLGNSNTVYTGDKSSFDSLYKLDITTLLDKFVFIVNIDNVDSIQITAPTNTYNINIKHTTTKASDGGKDQVENSTEINGKAINKDDFTKIYQDIIGLSLDTDTDKKVPEKPEITMTFNLNAGNTKKFTVTYTPYNDDFYSIYVNGQSSFIISKSKLTQLLDVLKNVK